MTFAGELLLVARYESRLDRLAHVTCVECFVYGSNQYTKKIGGTTIIRPVLIGQGFFIMILRKMCSAYCVRV